MAKKKYGLKAASFGNIEADGGMSTTLAAIGATVSESAMVEFAEATSTEFEIEESDDPFFMINSPGKKTVKLSSYDTDPATLVKWFGGTVTQDDDGNDKWNIPSNSVNIEQSIKLEMLKGGIWTITRANINASLVWNLSKSKLPQVNITATILTPEKANEPVAIWNDKVLANVVAPAITTQPQAKNIASGDDLVLTVVATGTAPLTYQWKKGGVSIAGATGTTYAKESVVVGDAGNYSVVITNGKGVATSDVVAVAVSA